ncbi:MAG: NlpC/P60 family protein [Candidatus Nanopelagicales bacterium]
MKWGMCKLAAVCAVIAGVLSGGGTPAHAEELGVGEAAQISVSVATVWRTPSSPRKSDAQAIAVPAQPASWLAGLSTAGRRGLNGRVETQALLGDEVRITGVSGGWAKIAVTGQASPKSGQGYPGWVPLAQLAGLTTTTPGESAYIVATTTRLFLDSDLSGPLLTVSYGTALPVVARSGRAVEVLTPDGMQLFVAASAVTANPPAASKTSLIKEAKRFLGRPYLWGGTSAFGFDCSGFTYAIYRHFGIAIPRDATPQYDSGTAVTKARLQPGDLVFFRNAGGIHHVGMYVGAGKMIHSPGTGSKIQLASITSGVWAREFAGGRRYLAG